ncbi:hypothetical protein GCM10011609_62710 [Lentzea pudingi]|uniref:Uncharacterized protein n=1 Tax=Lentzea pudingi TaxID=1789439 RepID=A0ABQ2IKS0_9PSEU|nr:hypothetical protein [Lentzea pudingi]GGN13605.1 hypothetical protein GCM10011609_62710 [Lentzea pudingi]
MTAERPDGLSPNTSNSATGSVQGAVVQSDSIDQVHVGHLDRRTFALLGASILAIVVVVVVALVLRSSTTAGSPSTQESSAQISTAEAPIAVESVAYMKASEPHHHFVFPDPLALSADEMAELSATNGNGKAYEDWALAHDGVYPNSVKLQIGLRATSRETLNITDVRIVKECRDPLSGTLLYSPTAGPTGSIAMFFDLDADYPVALDAPDGQGYFTGTAAQTIQLVPGEVATLLLDVSTRKSYCTFRFDLVLNPGGGRPELVKSVDYNGKPFAVSATTDFSVYRAIYAGGVAGRDGKFVAVDPKTFGG